ncbi:MAG: hypothetical protein J3R72DRAFT_367515 [Linnemannia gamsii]|nr:MAG: hypothetical protein J3R72DRAFT_367515 [Linnemannia gamsii]
MALAISSPVWVEITDPESRNTFYANLSSGECDWSLPEGAIIQHQNPAGEWWELFDDIHNLPYYYNTKTGQTEWERPHDSSSIISLTAIQASQAKPFSCLRILAIERLRIVSMSDEPTSEVLNDSSSSIVSPIYTPTESIAPSALATVVVKAQDSTEGPKVTPSKSVRSASSLSFFQKTSHSDTHAGPLSPPTSPTASRRLSTRGGVSPEGAHANQPTNTPSSPKSTPFTGIYPSLPAELQSSISQFRIAGFAQKYFSTHKKGLFRRRVPMERMLLHQKSPLSQPLMVLNKRGVQKDALRCFKIIQKLMGERKGNGYVGPTGIELGETCGLDHGELRDEIYVQLCKQLTENPSSIKGWHLFTILLITFAPSKNLHDYLASFLNQHATTSLHPIPVMAQHCHDLLRRISKRGSRAKLLTLVEIARAQEAAFRPSVFEATLERLMGRQMAAGGEWAAWRVPRLMVFLKECVIELGGLKTEGIFRISGDLGAVAELRARIELGNYDISGITDPHVPCSLLRLWIRDLPEPVIPYDLYQQCIQGAQDKDAVAKVITSLPLWHKEMIIYLISFLKSFNISTVKEATKMSLSNLAMVFAPTLLQCSSDDAPMLMGHLQAERAFVSTLISEVELADEDLRIVGEATGTP